MRFSGASAAPRDRLRVQIDILLDEALGKDTPARWSVSGCKDATASRLILSTYVRAGVADGARGRARPEAKKKKQLRTTGQQQREERGKQVKLSVRPHHDIREVRQRHPGAEGSEEHPGEAYPGTQFQDLLALEEEERE